ncbi:MAG: hypothetical protein PVG65_00110 [Candidatus Thorarchaeota archaeon]|jgi:hypothetical protein
MKKKITQLETYKRLRKTWKRNPKTIVHKKKRKSRQQEKIDLKKEL